MMCESVGESVSLLSSIVPPLDMQKSKTSGEGILKAIM